MENERVFRGERDIKYLYEQKNSKYMVVVFSGYSIHPTLKAPYNYINSLKNINVNKLFIADTYGYDGRGSWYLDDKDNIGIEKSVVDLIDYICIKNNIYKGNVILAGTSKGGFASIYYGIKYKFINIVAGGPQILLGDYLSDKERILYEMIVGDKKEIVSNLNKKIIELEKSLESKIYIYCGTEDHHLNNHIVPFINEMNDKCKIILKLLPGGHDELGNEFKNRFEEKIKDVICGDSIEEISNYEKISENIELSDLEDKIGSDSIGVRLEKNKLETSIDVPNINFEYACYLYKDGEIIEKRFYQNKPKFIFNINSIASYKLKWYIKDYKKKVICREVEVVLQASII